MSRTSTDPAVRPTTILLSGLLALLLAVASPGAPAEALSAFCGKSMEGVQADYADGRDNGHPLSEPGELSPWNGRGAISPLNRALFGLTRAKTIALSITSFIDRFQDGAPFKVANVWTATAVFLYDISIIALEVQKQNLEHQNGQVDACGDTLIGDFVDVMFVTMMEEDLAYANLTGSTSWVGEKPPAGTRVAPTAMHLLPQHGWPAWHRDASLYVDDPSHGKKTQPYVNGTMNGPYIGLAITVRNQIAYLEASGIDIPATAQQPDPMDSSKTITVHGAKELWEMGVEAMSVGKLDEAYLRFAGAYQRAVVGFPVAGSTPSSGSGSSDPSSGEGTGGSTSSDNGSTSSGDGTTSGDSGNSGFEGSGDPSGGEGTGEPGTGDGGDTTSGDPGDSGFQDPQPSP